jgi:GDP-4-dehydro-6-deoxy-D-mannose reductase
MDNKILITGACGMMGSHMIDYYNALGKDKVHGTFYKPTTNLNEYAHKAFMQECDVRYYHNVHKIISDIKPNIIFHLAAQSYPTVSLIRPQETMEINVTGTINVFESIKEIKRTDENYDPKVIVACSSAEYGSSLTFDNVPIKEDVCLEPLHPYGVSKVAQDLLSYQYFVSDGIKTIRSRIFNTTGPRKTNDVTSDFVKKAIQIERGAPNIFKVGNIESKRAITDVRDLNDALVLLAEKGKPGEVYNISGTKVYQVKDLIGIIEDIMGIQLNIEVDKNLLRPTDEPIIYGDSTRLIKDTGWQQKYSIEQTISDMINYWRAVL